MDDEKIASESYVGATTCWIMEIALFVAIGLFINSTWGEAAWYGFLAGYLYNSLAGPAFYEAGFARIMKIRAARKRIEARDAARADVWRMK